MATKDEKMRVLKMIEEGKINTLQGIELLNALDVSTSKNQAVTPVKTQALHHPQWMRVIVTDLNSGKSRVNVRLPAGLIGTGTKMGAHFSTNIEGIDAAKLREYVRMGRFGKIFDVVDEDDREHVEVYLE